MKNYLVPAILVKNFSDLKLQIKKVQKVFPLVQIDICDNLFVKNRTFKERLEINKLHLPCRLELHLMVKNPEKELKKWEKVKKVFRVYIHAETLKNNFEKILNIIQKNGWQLGLALNPETKTQKIQKYLDKIDAVLFMTVHPGIQGQKLIPQILKKIKSFKKPQKLLVAADGGITLDNIKQLKKSGVKEFCIGKRLVMAEDIKKTLREFNKLIKNPNS
ncbi:MAG TPA: hypothetical protein P5230_02165 [Candidatus Magasanikbacteria bacterium]|nr:hypothetical protein [Candidatus Magasanikbacteria bacterium]